MKLLLDLYATFFRIGLFTFGGGYAMLPLIQREVVEKKGWATEDEVMDYYAVGQCTPGVIAVNVATFIGYKNKGIAGGILATLGVVSPSIVIISIIAAFLSRFSDSAYVQHALAGIRLAVCALVTASQLSNAVKNSARQTTLLSSRGLSGTHRIQFFPNASNSILLPPSMAVSLIIFIRAPSLRIYCITALSKSQEKTPAKPICPAGVFYRFSRRIG